MTDAEIRQAQSLSKIDDFGKARAADFPATGLGGQKFAAVKALVAEIDTLSEAQASADGAARASVEAKRVARLSVLQKMRAIRETAKAMEAETPGVSDNFKVPTKNGDEALVHSARAFVTAATPLKADFVQREMPATFLEDLTAAIDEFESASNSANLNTGKRVGATAGLRDAFMRATRLKRELKPIVRNKYRNDASTLAAWKSASPIELPPKTKSKNAPPPPPPPPPSK